jgi:HCOMODA/2-hydroxy-3-carboxy-muconic semialdehyde decarboxylase
MNQPAASAPTTGGPVEPSFLEDLVLASHILAEQGVLDGYGHCSIRHPHAKDRFFLSASLSPAVIAVGDIMEYDLDSNPVDQRGRKMFLERFIHGEIYKARPDVNAVVHSHSPTVIPFSVTTVPLQPICHMSAFLGGGVPNFEIHEAAQITDLLIRDRHLGSALARTLGNRNVCLMRGHGSIAVGADIMTAVYRAAYTEVNAKLQAQAIALGGPIRFLSQGEYEMIESRNDKNYERPWRMWKERVTKP